MQRACSERATNMKEIERNIALMIINLEKQNEHTVDVMADVIELNSIVLFIYYFIMILLDWHLRCCPVMRTRPRNRGS